jgi:hypothetical protein
MGHPSVYPTGVTVYDVNKAWNGYTIFPSIRGAILLDMNGNEVNRWAGLGGFPNKILPGGYVLGNTLILVHENVKNPAISDRELIDDKVIEVTWDGDIIWEWRASDHFGEFGFSDAAKSVLRGNPGLVGEAGGDWMHINSLSTLGPNRHYDAGDERFHPDNLILDARNSNILFIVSKRTGEIVWRLGPDFDTDEATRKIGWIIGQHHFHLIPKGLPGEGDFLVFDNGGAGGYGAPNPASGDGRNNAVRDYSRVLQFDPVSLEIRWQYTPVEAGSLLFTDASKFYSSYISSAQRLPNGNTLITEGSDGRLIEVTPDHEIVWEYINPYYFEIGRKHKPEADFKGLRACGAVRRRIGRRHGHVCPHRTLLCPDVHLHPPDTHDGVGAAACDVVRHRRGEQGRGDIHGVVFPHPYEHVERHTPHRSKIDRSGTHVSPEAVEDVPEDIPALGPAEHLCRTEIGPRHLLDGRRRRGDDSGVERHRLQAE